MLAIGDHWLFSKETIKADDCLYRGYDLVGVTGKDGKLIKFSKYEPSAKCRLVLEILK